MRVRSRKLSLGVSAREIPKNVAKASPPCPHTGSWLLDAIAFLPLPSIRTNTNDPPAPQSFWIATPRESGEKLPVIAEHEKCTWRVVRRLASTITASPPEDGSKR